MPRMFDILRSKVPKEMIVMNKFKILAAVIGILIFSESAGIIFFATRSQNLYKKSRELTTKLEGVAPGYEKMYKESQEISAKYKQLETEIENLKADRENLLAQAKGLLGERAKAAEFQQLLDQNKAQIESAAKKIGGLKNNNLGLIQEIKRLRMVQGQLIKERGQLQAAYEKVQKGALVKELNNKIAKMQKDFSRDIANLQKEKNKAVSSLEQSQKQLAALNEKQTKLIAERDQLSSGLKAGKANYAQAVQKNKDLENQIKSMPTKFTEIARQNKILLKQTAEMHYNLGVFYTQTKKPAN